MILYCLVDKREDLPASFGLNYEKLNIYEAIKGKFEFYLVFIINIVYERAKFLKICQAERESVDAFINSFHKLAKHC